MKNINNLYILKINISNILYNNNNNFITLTNKYKYLKYILICVIN